MRPDLGRPLAARIVIFVGIAGTHIFDRRSRLGRFGGYRRRHWLGVTYLGDWLHRFWVMNLGDRLRDLGGSYLGSGLSGGGLGRANPLPGLQEDALI